MILVTYKFISLHTAKHRLKQTHGPTVILVTNLWSTSKYVCHSVTDVLHKNFAVLLVTVL